MNEYPSWINLKYIKIIYQTDIITYNVIYLEYLSPDDGILLCMLNIVRRVALQR